jgi:ligand-binding sensor domain-containing protein
MKKLYILLLIAIFPVISFSQNWKTLNTDNSSIPTNSITSIYAESNNSIWLCTYDLGLLHYDGHDFVQHNANSGEGIDLEHANYIIKDGHGNYWITSEYKGLYKLSKDGSWTHFTPKDMGFDLGAYQSLHLRKMALQHGGPGFPGGALWITTYSRGVIKYDGKSWKVFDYLSGALPNDGANVVAVEDSPSDTSAVVWVGLGGGFVKYDGKTWTKLAIGGDSTATVNSIVFDKGGISYANGVMYVGTFGQFCIYKNGKWNLFSVSDAWNPNNEVNDIKTDANHNVWFGTSSEGLWFYDESQLISYYKSNSGIPADNVLSLDVTHNNDSLYVWLTANYMGLTIFSNQFVTGIGKNILNPENIKLNVFPDPVKNNAVVSFSIPKISGGYSSRVSVTLFSLKGEKSAILLDKNISPGDYNINLNVEKYKLAAGEYILQLKVNSSAVSSKVIIQ